MYTCTLRRSNDSIAKQAVQWTRHGHRGTGRPWNAWKRDHEQEMWTVVQLEEDEDGSTRQSWMESSGPWSMLHSNTKAYIQVN